VALLKIAIFRKKKKLIFMAPSKSDFLDTEKIAFSWLPEKAIFRKKEKWLHRGSLKKRFFGYKKRFFVAP